MKINYFQLLFIVFFRSWRQSPELTLSIFAESDEKVYEKRTLKTLHVLKLRQQLHYPAKNCSWQFSKLFVRKLWHSLWQWHEIQTTSSLVMFCTSSDPAFIRGLRGENSIDIDEKTYFPTKVKSQHIFHWLCHPILPIQNGLGVEINVRLHVPSLLGNVLWLMNINSESLDDLKFIFGWTGL